VHSEAQLLMLLQEKVRESFCSACLEKAGVCQWMCNVLLFTW